MRNDNHTAAGNHILGKKTKLVYGVNVIYVIHVMFCFIPTSN